MAEVTKFTVSEGEQKQRLDNFLLSRMKDVPKAHVYRMIRKGSIRVNGKRAKAMSALTVGDLVSLPYLQEQSSRRVEIHPNVLLKVEHSILDQTVDFIILNKPVGMVCQPGDGFTYGIADCLEEILGERIYPVHRLDRGTSGVLVLARSAVAARVLQEALQSAQKIYHTIVYGCWKETNKIYKMQLEKCDRKMVVSSQGKWALSEFHSLHVTDQFSHMQVKISTGRMHQIRVMLSELGYPVIGDALYGKKGSCLGWSKQIPFLHASELNFNYKGEEFSFQAPLTQEQQLCLKALYPKK
jgi:23S rRNA pseudouridine955/2504/2580 synthase